MRCFYCENLREGELSGDDFSEKESRHLFKVLRGKTGEKILLLNGKGKIAKAAIGDKNTITVSSISSPSPPPVKLHLFMAPPRKQKIDQLLKQCSEIGIRSVTLLITERGVSQPDRESSFERMRQHLMEGCKQAHNPYLPLLNRPIDLKTAVKEISAMDDAYFGSTKQAVTDHRLLTCTGSADNGPLSDQRLPKEIAWIVGPEGGFTEEEEELMVKSGVHPLSIGPWVMRIETAAVTGGNLLMRRF